MTEQLVKNKSKASALSSSSSSALSSYAELRARVSEALLDGQRKIERQKLQTYWQSGMYLHEHIFPRESRAEHYGKDVIERLAKDLDVSSRLLYQCLQLYRSFKNLHARANSFSQLSWAHFRAAMRVPDERKRLEVIEKAAREEWNSRDMEVEVRNRRWSERTSGSEDKKIPRLPFVCLGPFYTYQIIRPETVHSRAKELLLDLGFGHRLEMDLFPGARFPAETIVTSVQNKPLVSSRSFKDFTSGKRPAACGPNYSLIQTKDAADALYTFKAYVAEVVDGDTLKVEFQLGFGNRQSQIIRLNHIDCPEMDTPEGKAAKRFTESQLQGCDFITIKSIKTRKEKWGRYLGDVFISRSPLVSSRAVERKTAKSARNLSGHSVSERPATSGYIYLNQLLLDKGHAVRVRW